MDKLSWDWDPDDDPLDHTDEPSDEEMEDAAQLKPWRPGLNGKGLLLVGGEELLIWATDEMGEPHHDVAGVPYLAKLDIFPSGVVVIMSPDEENLFGISREDAEEILERLAPQYGLRFSRAFTTKRHPTWELVGIQPEPDTNTVGARIPVEAHVRSQRSIKARLSAESPIQPGLDQMTHERIIACPTCGDPLKGEFGTYCPRCSWSEHNPNIDHDPLSNPPDPTVDMHRGIQARTAAYEPFTFPTGKQVNVDWDRGTIQHPEDPETEETFDEFMNNLGWRHSPADYAPYPDPHADFWRQPQVVYHGTDEENIPTIMQEGLRPSNKTRGVQNRGIGAAVFTTPTASTAQYHYGPVLAIDAPRMKADGYMPQVGSDGFDDAWHKEAVAHALGHEWYDEGNYGGEDPDTVVFHDHIPPQYLSRVDDGDAQHFSAVIPNHRWFTAVEDSP